MASGYGILIPLKYAGVLRRFSPELCGRLLLMALDLGETREETQLPVEDPLSVVWALLQADISEALTSYDRRVEGGRKGGKQAKASLSILKDTEDNKVLDSIILESKREESKREESISAADKPHAPAPKSRKSIAPTIEEIKAYCLERDSTVDPQRFFDFYAANGWVQGKGKPIKDWRACVRTWEHREQQNKPADAPLDGLELVQVGDHREWRRKL